MGRVRPIGVPSVLRLRRARGVALAVLVLAGCGAPGLDREQAAEERRTCASLRERVAARAVEDAGLVDGLPTGADPKGDPLSPAVLLDDPEAWYAALAAALDDQDLGPLDGPSSVSPASRLVDRCRDLSP